MRHLLVLLALAAAAPAQDLVADGPRFRVNDATQFTQKEPQNDANPDGDRVFVVWQSALGSTIFTRLFDEDGDPLTGELEGNPVFGANNQSEPEAVMDDDGNVMLAWSDWNGNDGDGMGIFGRVFDQTGAPKGDDFQVNQLWVNSQWEPKGYGRPSGFVMAWSGDPDGNAYFRLFDADGNPESGDVQANVLTNNAQIDTTVAVGRDGTIFMVYVDYGGNGAGAGQNLFARTFSDGGVPVQAVEFEVNTGLPLGNDREPRAAADGMGRFVVVWENWEGDADGKGIWARRYDGDGVPLGPEFPVNTTETGDQEKPDVACSWMGDFVVTFADWSTGRSVIRARRFDFEGTPLGDDFEVDASAAGDQVFGSVSSDWAGEDFLVSWASPGEAGTDGTNDVYARRFVTEPLTVSGTPAPGVPFTLDLELAGSAGLSYAILASLGTDPGLPLPDGRRVHMNLDPVMNYALFNPFGPIFSDFQGVMDGNDGAQATVTLPNNGALSGVTLYFSAITLDITEPNLLLQLRHVTDPIAVPIL